MRKAVVFNIALILISIIIGIYFYARFPDMIISHWNAQGIADGYLPKFWGLFLFPMILIGIFLLFTLLPLIDPLKENYKKFRKYYDLMLFTLEIFLFYIFILSILVNGGYPINIFYLMVPAFGLLLFVIGIIIEKSKRNWFLGIRTPWTLSSDFVWEKTHKFGGRLFKISGLIAFVGLIFPNYSLWFILVPVILSSVISIVYSYVIYKNSKQ